MEQKRIVNGDNMESLPETDIEFLAWQSVLERLDEKRRARLKELLREQRSHPATLQQRINRWEKELSMDESGMSADLHVAALEACLEEAIATVKALAHDDV